MHDLPPESMIKNWVKIPADSHSKCALIDRIKLNSDILPTKLAFDIHRLLSSRHLDDPHQEQKKTSTTLTAFVSS